MNSIRKCVHYACLSGKTPNTAYFPYAKRNSRGSDRLGYALIAMSAIIRTVTAVKGRADQTPESRTMIFILRSFTFFLTIVLGAIAFAATAIEFPTLMSQLIDWAQQLPAYLSTLGLSPSYQVWINILLTGDKLVLLGFVFVTRVIIAIVVTAIGPIFMRKKRRADTEWDENWG